MKRVYMMDAANLISQSQIELTIIEDKVEDKSEKEINEVIGEIQKETKRIINSHRNIEIVTNCIKAVKRIDNVIIILLCLIIIFILLIILMKYIKR